jgi:serine/threonine-protein kinase HipA
VKALLDAGSGSLGGARPKASVRDDERLLIAKFPHPDDEWDVMAWEKTALDLASAAGIRVPRARLVQVDRRSVLLVERFDREAQRRVPYVSAMTLLEARDGDTHDYVEIAEAMADVSAGASADLNELWRRIAFSVLINNTDDHLRNHGFLHRRGGWQLSPAFDLNPDPDVRASRQTPIAGVETRAGAIDALMAYADAFRVDPPATAEILGRVSDAVSGWRKIAAGNGIRARELDLFEPALTR